MATTADALLATVRADPDADLPRLVYADHLDDTGDADRAEFIRVQCELARLDEWDDRRPALEDREHELLDANEPAWLGELGGYCYEWEWRRGFVDEVSGSAGQFRWMGSTSYAGHPVQRAHIVTWRAGPNMPQGVFPGPWMTPLRRLSLADAELTSGMLRALVRSPDLSALTALDVSENPVLAELPDVLAEASFLDGLRELEAGGQTRLGRSAEAGDRLDGERLSVVIANSPVERMLLLDCGLTGYDLGHLLTVSRAGRLTDWDVSDNNLRDRDYLLFGHGPTALTRLAVSGNSAGSGGLGRLVEADGLQQLSRFEANRTATNPRRLAMTGFWGRATELRLHSCGIGGEEMDAFDNDGVWQGLRLLDLADNELGPDGGLKLADAARTNRLTWLALSRNRLNDAAVAQLARCDMFTHLRTLHLAFDPITDAGAAVLASAPSLARLRLLTFSHTEITDRSVQVLLDAPHWQLSGLGLAGCNLSERAVHALATSPRLHRLQWLDLSGNPRLGGDALMPLAESPHLSRLCELDIGGVDASDRVRDALRQRLGRRLSD